MEEGNHCRLCHSLCSLYAFDLNTESPRIVSFTCGSLYLIQRVGVQHCEVKFACNKYVNQYTKLGHDDMLPINNLFYFWWKHVTLIPLIRNQWNKGKDPMVIICQSNGKSNIGEVHSHVFNNNNSTLTYVLIGVYIVCHCGRIMQWEYSYDCNIVIGNFIYQCVDHCTKVYFLT